MGEQRGPALTLQWSDGVSLTGEAAAFAGRVIGSDTRYISHGEVQTGLSPDGEHWAPDLGALYGADFAELGEDRDLLVATDTSGRIAGIAVVAWEESSRRKFAVLEDMAVEPAMRSQGIGEALLQEIEARIRSRGVDLLFLESGLHNHGAHKFFERNGFRTMSHVFMKHVDDQA